MSIYFFFIGILLVGLGLFVRFKLQNNFKIGSDNFKKIRSVRYILLVIGIIVRLLEVKLFKFQFKIYTMPEKIFYPYLFAFVGGAKVKEAFIKEKL